ncbi:hypothetical protein V7138_17365 [Bacillus sp. JJ1533]|uniref:hypothetical protein n=1 Tax=Bacillus sp. JJ1533 TaxID=3122959 RepID=UPI002FFF24CC
MADINEHKRNENDTGYAVETGDTIASALDPFGSSAGPIAGTVENKSEKDIAEDDKQDSKNKSIE